MAATDRTDLKERFADGQTPSGADFSELIDEIREQAPTETATALPVSTEVAADGTDTTGLVSPAGVKAHVDRRRANRGEAQVGVSHEKLMTPLRTKEAIAAQVPSFITSATSSILSTLRGGVNNAYNTLQGLYSYITNSFYNRSQSDARYDRRADYISGSRIASGISASNITTGILSTLRVPNLSASKITSGTLSSARIPEIRRTKLSNNLRATLENNVLFFAILPVPSVEGAWAFSFIYNLEQNATVAYEVFVSTATVVRIFTLVSHRIGGSISSSRYEQGNISRGAVGSSNSVIEVADNTTTGQPHDRLIYVKPLTSLSTRVLTRIDISHRRDTSISQSLSPLYAI